jgi:hypothetical protein
LIAGVNPFIGGNGAFTGLKPFSVQLLDMPGAIYFIESAACNTMKKMAGKSA